MAKGIAAILSIVVCCGSALAAEPVTMKWTIEGVEREALVYAPSKNPARGKAPLLFELGRSSNALT